MAAPEVPSSTDFIVKILHTTEDREERASIERRLRNGGMDRVFCRQALIDLTLEEFRKNAEPFSNWLGEPEQEALTARIISRTPLPIMHTVILRIRPGLDTEEIIDRISTAPGVERVVPNEPVNLVIGR